MPLFYKYKTLSVTCKQEYSPNVNEIKFREKIFGLKEEEISGWSKSRNEKLHDLYSSSHIIRIISSRKIIWLLHMARIDEKN
jgi:hypothetical protein